MAVVQCINLITYSKKNIITFYHCLNICILCKDKNIETRKWHLIVYLSVFKLAHAVAFEFPVTLYLFVLKSHTHLPIQ